MEHTLARARVDQNLLLPTRVVFTLAFKALQLVSRWAMVQTTREGLMLRDAAPMMVKCTLTDTVGWPRSLLLNPVG